MDNLLILLQAYLEGDRSVMPKLLAADAALVTLIREQMPHQTDRNQWRLLVLLGELKRAETVDIIIPFLAHPRKPLQALAAQILGSLQGDQIVEVLIDQLQQPESAVHIWVAQALGKLDDEQAIAPLCAMMQATTSEVILYTSIEALGQLADASLIPLIEPYLTHESHHVRRHTEDALIALRQKAKGDTDDS